MQNTNQDTANIEFMFTAKFPSGAVCYRLWSMPAKIVQAMELEALREDISFMAGSMGYGLKERLNAPGGEFLCENPKLKGLFAETQSSSSGSPRPSSSPQAIVDGLIESSGSLEDALS